MRLTLALLVVGYSIGLSQVAAQSGGTLPDTEDAPAELVAALDAYIPANFEGDYLGGPCESGTPATDDGGKWCWTLTELSESRATVDVGRYATSGQPGKSVIFTRQSDGTWSAAPGAPDTGSGWTDTNETNYLEVVSVAAILLVVSATALATRCRSEPNG